MTRVYVDARLPWGSGIGRYVSEVIPRILRLNPGVEFVVGVDLRNVHPALSIVEQFPNTQVVRSNISPFSFREQTSLYNDVGPVDFTWFTNYWIPFFWPTPFVATVHDVLHLRKDLFPAPDIKRIVSKFSMELLRRRAAGLLFVSEFTRKEFQLHVGSAQRTLVVHHGGNHLAWSGPPVKKEHIALIVGAPKVHKNIQFAINAWAEARIPKPWRLVVVSPGDELRSSVELDSRQSAIQYKTAVSDEELQSLYQRSSVFLFPTKYEGFGFPMIEAAFSGARIIASTAGALLEIADRMEAEFIRPDDKAAWIKAIRKYTAMQLPKSTDPEVKQNVMVAATFDWDRCAADTSRFITSCLVKSAGPRGTLAIPE